MHRATAVRIATSAATKHKLDQGDRNPAPSGGVTWVPATGYAQRIRDYLGYRPDDAAEEQFKAWQDALSSMLCILAVALLLPHRIGSKVGTASWHRDAVVPATR